MQSIRRVAQTPRIAFATSLQPTRTSFSSRLTSPRPLFSPKAFPRHLATDNSATLAAPDYLDEGERKIFEIVKDGLKPTKLEVQDVSGGCGSMYALDVVSEQFKGMPLVKQHRLVKSLLGDLMKEWHGIQLQTRAP